MKIQTIRREMFFPERSLIMQQTILNKCLINNLHNKFSFQSFTLYGNVKICEILSWNGTVN